MGNSLSSELYEFSQAGNVSEVERVIGLIAAAKGNINSQNNKVGQRTHIY